jgi:hypothetical protein
MKHLGGIGDNAEFRHFSHNTEPSAKHPTHWWGAKIFNTCSIICIGLTLHVDLYSNWLHI